MHLVPGRALLELADTDANTGVAESALAFVMPPDLAMIGAAGAVAACLTRNLRKVGFADLAPSFTWDGAFHFDADGPSIEVNVQSLYGKLYGLVAESVVLAAIDQPAECMTTFFTADPVMSAVLIVTFDAHGAHVEESTADPGNAVDCVTSLLAPITWPSELLRGAKLRVALLRPTTVDPSDASINMITADPPSPSPARKK